MAVVSERSLDDLEAALRAGEDDCRRAHAAFFADLAEHDRREGWTLSGARNEEEYLVRSFEVKRQTAFAWTRTARMLARRPRVAALLADAVMSVDSAVALAEYLEAEDARNTAALGPFDPLPDDGGGEPSGGPDGGTGAGTDPDPDTGLPNGDAPDTGVSDDEAIELAGTLTPQRLALMAARLRAERAEEANRLHRRRHFECRRDVPGRRLHISDSDLFDDDAATVWTALEEFYRQAKPNPETGRFDPINLQNADALVAWASAYLQIRERTTQRPLLLLHADLRVLAGDDGWAETSDHSPVDAETIRRLACGCQLTITGDDPEGNPLFLGRSARHASWKQTEIIRRRDGGCRACGQTYFTEVHHLRFWERDLGRTDVTNMALICHRCHRMLHEGGWHIEGDPQGPLHFHGPNGQHFTTHPVPQPGGPLPGSRRSTRRRAAASSPGDPAPAADDNVPSGTKTSARAGKAATPSAKTKPRQPPDPLAAKGKHARERTRTARLF